MKKLFILTDSDSPNLHPDDDGLIQALQEHMIEAIPVIWDEFTPEPNSNILIRTPWDYAVKRQKFEKLLNEIDSSTSKLINPVEIVRWNMNKAYMLELQDKGVNVVETKVVEDAKLDESILQGLSYPVVLKPLVGAGGKDTFLVHNNTELKKCTALTDRDVMVQPFIDSIQSVGEYSFLFFNGEFSHAVLKKASSNEFRVQEEHGGSVEVYKPSTEQIEKVQKTLE
ncbi:MAG: hypothetical protein KC478_04845, partial [Bacteriovoracaceae bacterium]|nr:hypothetical protein [Bacteriovoracaceae bacterium]